MSSIKCERKLRKEVSIKVTAKVGDIARGQCQNYFENVDMIGNSLCFLFERLALLNSFVTLLVMVLYTKLSRNFQLCNAFRISMIVFRAGDTISKSK